MKTSKIEMGEFDRKSYENFEQYMNKNSANNFYKEIYSNLKNNFECMEKASGLTGCANAIKSTLDNLKKLYSQATQTAYGMAGYKSSYNDSVKTIEGLCTLIQDKNTAQIIEKHLKYKELKSKNKLTKIFVFMFGRIIKGSEYKRLKSRIKNYQNKISKNLNSYKVSTYCYTSITDFFATCMEQLLRQTQQLIYSIMGTFVESQDDKFADDQLITSNGSKIINSIDDIVEKDFVQIGDIVHPVGDRYNVDDYHLLAILDKFTEYGGKKKLRECFVKASNNKVTIRFFKVDISRVGLNKFKFTPKSPILIEVDASSFLKSSGEESGLWVKLIRKAYAVYCNKIQNTSKEITTKDMEYMCYSEGMVMCALTGDTSMEEFPLNSWFCKKDSDKMKKLYEKINKAIKDKQIVTVVLDGTGEDKNLKKDIPYFVKDIYNTRAGCIIELIDHSTMPNAEIREKIKDYGNDVQYNGWYKGGRVIEQNFEIVYWKLKRISYSKTK